MVFYKLLIKAVKNRTRIERIKLIFADFISVQFALWLLVKNTNKWVNWVTSNKKAPHAGLNM